MKKITLYSAIAALLSLAAGCDLTLLPEHETTPEQYFRTESDLLLWSNNFYTDNFPEADIGANDGDDKIDNGLSAYITGSRNAATQSWGFTSLRNINYMLEHLDQCGDPAVRTKYEALGRFFRGYFYFKRVQTYGDIPWYDKVLESNDPDLYKGRDDRGFVMDKVLEDFDFAYRNLPSTWESRNTRVTKWAALAFASRAALYEGTFRKYHQGDMTFKDNADGEKYIRIAAETAREFIDKAPFSLYSEGTQPYRDLFWNREPKTEEVVLCRYYNTDFNIKHSVPNNISFGRTSLTRRFMNHYLMADGSRFTEKDGWQTMEYNKETVGRDPRMAQTVLCPGYKQVGETDVTPCKLYSHTGYEPIKYIGNSKSQITGNGQCPWIIMRAAEVYLNYAEALAELGTLTQNDLDLSVNKIRARAKMPAISLETANADPDPYLLQCYPNVTKSDMTGVILEIRRERTVELVMEDASRAWDLFRWKEAKNALNAFTPYYGCYIKGAGTYDMDNDGTDDLEIYTGEKGTTNCPTQLKLGTDLHLSEGDHGYITAYYDSQLGAGWNDRKDYLWPVPKAQIELNPKLSQNYGWDDAITEE